MVTKDIEYFDLEQIADSGQCFRWRKLDNYKYRIPAFGNYLDIAQTGSHFELSCTEEEYRQAWYNYFDLGTDYKGLVQRINPEDTFLKNAAEYGKGIRILKQDIWELAGRYNGGKHFKVVANLPYYITTPIIMGFLERDTPVDSITVMVQREVAERMQAGPGTKAYGALSLAVQYYSKPYLAANVPQNCFMPRPNVASAVINLEKYDKPPVETKDVSLMFELIRASFGQRRKTLWNGIKNCDKLDYEREHVEQTLRKMGLDVNVRGETLSLARFAELASLL